MDNFFKGYVSGMISTFIALAFGYAFITIISNRPGDESLVIEYSSSVPYERRLPIQLENSITNSFKYKKISMDKYLVRIELVNPPDSSDDEK